MFGMGGSAMISVALGENNHQSVKKISSFISWASLVVGAAFAAVLLCFTAPILHLFGATQAHLSLPAATRFTSRSAHRLSSGRRQPASLCVRKARARRP
ncbi:MAG: MATE family efflux transporter [Butyricicoccus sp.]